MGKWELQSISNEFCRGRKSILHKPINISLTYCLGMHKIGTVYTGKASGRLKSI